MNGAKRVTFKQVEPGRFTLEGDVTFENASVVESEGLKVLQKSMADAPAHWQICLLGIQQADSSALSVCLSWLRFAQKQNARLCFTDIPRELHALARVCGISELLTSVSFPQ